YMDVANSAAPADIIDRAKRDVANWLQRWTTGAARDDFWDTDSLVRLCRDTRYALLGRQGFGRMVWYIDDLDRCEPEVVLEILRAHRAFMSEAGMVLIYAMDYNIVSQLVGDHVRSKGPQLLVISQDPRMQSVAWGQMYLEKFFGRRIRPPEPRQEAV